MPTILNTLLAAALALLGACAYIHPSPPNEPTPGSSYNPITHERNESAR